MPRVRGFKRQTNTWSFPLHHFNQDLLYPFYIPILFYIHRHTEHIYNFDLKKEMFPKRICSCLLLVLIILLASILVLETAHSLQSSRLDRLSPISIEDDYDDNTAFKINSKWKSLLRQTSHGHDRIKAPKDPIMGKMTNATLKAELGRSAWRVLHVYVFCTAISL